MRFYLTFSKGYFVPELFRSRDAFSEAFRSSFNSFESRIANSDTNLRAGSGDDEYILKGLHVPHVGEVAVSTKKNVAWRMLLHRRYEKAPYGESPEFRSVPHVPLLVQYRKKVQFEQDHLGIKTNPIRVYVHIFPSGYSFIHAAVAGNFNSPLSSFIEWLGKAKLPETSPNALRVSVGNRFNGSLSGFFNYIWTRVSNAVLSDSSATTIESPIYDILRIKPLQSMFQVPISSHESFMDSYERNESSGSSDKSRWDQPRFQSWEQLFDAIFDRWEEIKAEYENGEAYRRIKKSSWEAKLIKRLKRTSHRHRYSTDEEAHKHLLLRLELRSKWSSEVKKTLSDKKLGNDVRGMHEQLQRLELFDSGEFPDWIRHELVKGITLALRQANRIKLDANEIAGLLGKDRRWRELACDESDYDSVFGKYGSDLIVTKNQSALIKTEIWSTRKQLQLWFHWKLIAVYEIACAQWLATEMMRQEMDRASSSSTPTSGFSDVSRRFNLLATTQRHLPPSFRKWYYCVSSSIGTDRRLAEVGSEQQRFDHGQLLRRLEMHDYKNEAIILFLGANPSDTTQLELPKEAQAIDDRLRNTELRDQFKIEQQWEPKAQQIPGKIMRFNPTIVHFSGHGSKCGNLVFVDEDNIAREADTESIAEIFRLINETVRCVVLNACYSNKQAAAIAEHVEIVIGMSQAIGDKDAIQFSSSFYEALGYGKSFQKAFELAKLGMKLSESDDALVPKMFHRDGIDPNDCFCF